MRNLIFCLSSILLLSSGAFAGVCENAAKGADRKAATADLHCKNSTQVNRLTERFNKATTDKSKATIKKLLDKAVKKQAAYCTLKDTLVAQATKIKGFCTISSQDTSTCKFGFSLRVKGGEASSRCKMGRGWTKPDNATENKCYYIEAYFYTAKTDWEKGKANPRGSILTDQAPPGAKYFQLNTGFLLESVKKQADCK